MKVLEIGACDEHEFVSSVQKFGFTCKNILSEAGILGTDEMMGYLRHDGDVTCHSPRTDPVNPRCYVGTT